jgi:GNAT superfamily N-acetyltransferase
MNFEKIIFRKAFETDLSRIIEMLHNDILGKDREVSDNFANYKKAFDEIMADKNNFLMIIELEKEVIGTCHLTIMPSLTLQGSKRMNIEAVRVDEKFSGQGIGSWMMKKAIEFAKNNEVKILQLTTNKKRLDAHRFYERLGFEKTHEGMKMKI